MPRHVTLGPVAVETQPSDPNLPVSQPSALADPVSVLSRSRSRSPPAFLVSSSPSSARSSVPTQDSRTFQEVLNTELATRNPKRIGKIITNERFAPLVIACVTSYWAETSYRPIAFPIGHRMFSGQ